MTPGEIERVFDWYNNLGPSVVNVTGSLYQLAICLNKSYVWSIYFMNMIEDSLVCKLNQLLNHVLSVRSVINILRDERIASCIIMSKVDSFWRTASQTPCLGNIPIQATPMLCVLGVSMLVFISSYLTDFNVRR